VEYLVGRLDVEFADVDGQVGRYHVYEFLEDAVAVDALDMYMCQESRPRVFPPHGHYARSVAGLEYLGTRTVERVNLDLAGLGDVSQRVVVPVSACSRGL